MNKFTLLSIILIISVFNFSCRKGFSITDTTNTDSTNTTTGGSAGLIKTITIESSSDKRTSIDTLVYDSQKRLISIHGVVTDSTNQSYLSKVTYSYSGNAQYPYSYSCTSTDPYSYSQTDNLDFNTAGQIITDSILSHFDNNSSMSYGAGISFNYFYKNNVVIKNVNMPDEGNAFGLDSSWVDNSGNIIKKTWSYFDKGANTYHPFMICERSYTTILNPFYKIPKVDVFILRTNNMYWDDEMLQSKYLPLTETYYYGGTLTSYSETGIYSYNVSNNSKGQLEKLLITENGANLAIATFYFTYY